MSRNNKPAYGTEHRNASSARRCHERLRLCARITRDSREVVGKAKINVHMAVMPGAGRESASRRCGRGVASAARRRANGGRSYRPRAASLYRTRLYRTKRKLLISVVRCVTHLLAPVG
jgi:hypothetical protein